MNKNVVVVFILLLIGIIGWLWYENDDKDTKIMNLQRIYENKNNELKKAEITKNKLREEIELKAGKIYALEEDISFKEKFISQLQNEKQKLNERIKTLNRSLDKIRTEIQTNSEGDNSSSAIMQLEEVLLAMKQENEELNIQLETLNRQNDSLIFERNRIVKERDDLKLEKIKWFYKIDSLENVLSFQDSTIFALKNQAELINNVVRNSKITLLSLSASQKANGKNKIKKIRKKNKPWNFTNCSFELTNSSIDLHGLQFGIRILDEDNNIFVENIEENPAFPSSNSYLVPFFFNEGPIHLSHINYQDKESENYSIQFVFINENNEYMIENGGFKLFKNGVFEK